MKSILIIGKNSYISKSFVSYLNNVSDYKIKQISVRNNEWKQDNWSKYNVVINFTGIAHKPNNSIKRDEYYKVNEKLAVELAEKAKKDKVYHFIQISTMSVFGNRNSVITKKITEKPTSDYGKSKLEADNKIKKMTDDFFLVSIIRPPMVYGHKSPGNYKKLSKLAKYMIVFPKVENKRSMIYIDNLSEFIFICIKRQLGGEFYPQNSEYVNTANLVKLIRNEYGKKMYYINVNFILSFLIKHVGVFNKIFGNLVYSKEISNFELNYNKIDFRTSIKETEKRD